MTPKDIKEAIAHIAIEKFVDELYSDYMTDSAYTSIETHAKELVKEHQKEIIDEVIKRVSGDISRKKAIVNEMPKKYEIENINKDWEDYFVSLIDKAIAKRFKG